MYAFEGDTGYSTGETGYSQYLQQQQYDVSQQQFDGADGTYGDASWAAWDTQQWGSTGYDQVAYDCSGWDYSQQGWHTGDASGHQTGLVALGVAPAAAVSSSVGPIGPLASQPVAPGQANGVTSVGTGAELLTELRLAELKRLIDRDAKVYRPQPEGVEIQSEQSAECTTRAPESNEDTPIKSIAAGSAQEAARSNAADGVCAPGRPTIGLQQPDEKMIVALYDFEPESRRYDELPVRSGDEVWTDGEGSGGWIFGFKRGAKPDEGWLPRAALGLEVEDSEDEARSTGSVEVAPLRRQQRGRTVSNGRAPPAEAGKRRGTSQAAKDDDPDQWHQHGNWWSKQRHLRSEKENASAATLSAAEDKTPAKKGKGRRAASEEDDRGRASRNAWGEPSRSSKNRAKSSDGKGNATAKGATSAKGPSKGGKAQAGPTGARERPQRQRPALTSLLDRLNKPLVAPASKSSKAGADREAA